MGKDGRTEGSESARGESSRNERAKEQGEGLARLFTYFTVP